MANRTFSAMATITLGLSVFGAASADGLTSGGRLSPQDLAAIGTQPTAGASAHFTGGGDDHQDFRVLGGRLSAQDLSDIGSTGSSRFAAHFSSGEMRVPDRILGGRLTKYDLGDRGVVAGPPVRSGGDGDRQAVAHDVDTRLLGGRLSPADLALGGSSGSVSFSAHFRGDDIADSESTRVLGGRITAYDLRDPAADPAGDVSVTLSGAAAAAGKAGDYRSGEHVGRHDFRG